MQVILIQIIRFSITHKENSIEYLLQSREVSCCILEKLVEKDKELMRQHLPYIFQIFSRRLSEEEDYEPSEEVGLTKNYGLCISNINRVN